MKNYKKMPYALPDGYMELAKIRAKAAIATQSRKEERWWQHRAFALAAASVLVALIAVGVVKESIGIDAHEKFIAQLKSMPTEVLYEISCDAVEYNDEDLLSDLSK